MVLRRAIVDGTVFRVIAKDIGRIRSAGFQPNGLKLTIDGLSS
jgi:hypothetical protein